MTDPGILQEGIRKSSRSVAETKIKQEPEKSVRTETPGPSSQLDSRVLQAKGFWLNRVSLKKLNPVLSVYFFFLIFTY